ncbi:hypothetical protein RJ640_022272 [Escallonia rubra]|uniref:Transposase (putative) gypsy type domain-containing protein n=1 Tax=Escallonia rubra TaxID=112253 RepID=A0AA88QMT6_9ASTE|nr:hypothetical protein RJ640_022272 [Escallonia rubra]
MCEINSLTHVVFTHLNGDVKDQAEDKANPKPWYTADEKSSKMSTEDLQDLIQEYPLPEGWYARLPGLGEPANYGTKFETGVYEEQVKSGYRLPLHPFALRFFEHYRMAPGQLVPNGWRKLAGLIYLVQTSDEPLSEEQLEWAKIIPSKPIPAGLLIPPLPAIPSVSSAETVPLEMASGGGKSQHGGFLGVLQKAKGKRKEKQPSVELLPAPKRTRVTPSERSPRILEQVSIEDDPIFRPRWTLRRDDLGMPDSQVSEQHLRHGILPRDKEVFQNQTHETFACSFAQAVYTMYASGSEMFSRFEMARQVAAEEAQLTREAVKEAQEATHRAEELSKREEDHLDRIATLEKKLDRVKKRAAEEAKEMFAERFPDIPLDDFVLPAVVSPSGETVMPPEAGDVAASDLPGEGFRCPLKGLYVKLYLFIIPYASPQANQPRSGPTGDERNGSFGMNEAVGKERRPKVGFGGVPKTSLVTWRWLSILGLHSIPIQDEPGVQGFGYEKLKEKQRLKRFNVDLVTGLLEKLEHTLPLVSILLNIQGQSGIHGWPWNERQVWGQVDTFKAKVVSMVGPGMNA